MRRIYTVIDEKPGEGVIFDNETDAEFALRGRNTDHPPGVSIGVSSLAESFREIYEDDTNFTMMVIEI